MRLKTLIVLAVIVLVSAAGYAVWWIEAARTIERQVQLWIADQRARAAFIDYKSFAVGGFPFALSARTTDVSIRLPSGLAWQGPELVVAAAPWDLTALTISLRGVQHAALPGAGIRPPLDVTADGGHGTVRLTTGGLLRHADLTLGHTTVTPGAAGGQSPLLAVTAESVEVGVTAPLAPPRDHTQPALDLDLRAANVALPPAIRSPLGPAIASASVAATIMGALPLPPTVAQLAAWTDSGGTVEVSQLDLAWGPLTLAASGTLALDRDLQPIGALTAKVRGFDQALDAFAAAGQLAPNQASVAKVALGLLAQPGKDGEKVVTAPISAQDGWLYFGPIRFARVPRVAWQG